MRNFAGQQRKRSIRMGFSMIVIFSLLALPVGTALADILNVTNFSNQLISVIDTDQGDAEVATIGVGFDTATGDPLIPWCIAVTPDGTRAYITTDPFDLDDGGNVFIIDTASHTISSGPFRFPPQGEVGGGGNPCVVISPDGTRAYLSNGSTDPTSRISEIVAIPTNENPPVTELLKINTGRFTTGRLRLSPDGSTLYALPSSFSVSELQKIDGVVDVPQLPEKIAFSGEFNRFTSSLAFTTREGINFLYVTSSTTANIQVLNTATNLISVIPLPGVAAGIAMTLDGKFAYVALLFENQVVVIDTATNALVGAAIQVGDLPLNIAISPDGNFAYVTNFLSGDITVINTTDNMVVRTINVGGDPYQIAVLPGVAEEPQRVDHFLGYPIKPAKH